MSAALAEAMESYRPGMTWLDAYDHVLAKVRAMGFKQTPQLIGRGGLTIFGSEEANVPPHLLVTNVHEREIEVLAPAALGLGTGERGARLAIYPPGSAMVEPPIGIARVKYLTETGVAASLESQVIVPLASRVRVLEHGDNASVIAVGVPDDVREWMGVSSLVAFELDGIASADFTVSDEQEA
jgi:hypothetical protein